jgi:hypothetical protein
MKRILFATGLVGLIALAAAAQKTPDGQTVAPPDLSGTWEMAEGSPNMKDRVFVIEQTPEQITISDTFEHRKKRYANKTVLFPDKRGETNHVEFPGADEPTKIRSKTAWEKNKLVRRSTFETWLEFRGECHIQKNDEVQTFSLSEDGSELTVHTSARRELAFSTIVRPINGKTVFRRKK